MSTKITKREEQKPERVSQRRFVLPRVDLFENDDELLLVADLPGVNKDNLTVEVNEGVLSLEGRRAEPPKNANVVGAEFVGADFSRRFTLPDGVDVEMIAAELENGVLTLRLPKAAALKPRQIPVKSG